MKRMDVLWDMETQDPDDFLTLCLLATHPGVCLRAVTVMPGSDAQIGIVRHTLKALGHVPIPIGSCAPGYEKDAVSSFHHRFLGIVAPAKPDGRGDDIIMAVLKQFPHATLITGAPLKNFSRIANEIVLDRWVAQGGFAGEGVMPAHLVLDKFRGRKTCATFNFNGDPSTALAMLGSPTIEQVFCVSKNVCHGLVYDEELHKRIERVDRSPGLDMIFRAMGVFLERHPSGKKLHDPLAACAAIDPAVCDFVEVELYRERGEWGSRKKEGTKRFISIGVDRERFFRVLTSTAE